MSMKKKALELEAAQNEYKTLQSEFLGRLRTNASLVLAVRKKEEKRGNATLPSMLAWSKEVWKTGAELSWTGREDFPVRVGDHTVHRTFLEGSMWDIVKNARLLIRTEQQHLLAQSVKKTQIRLNTQERTLEWRKKELEEEYLKKVAQCEKEHAAKVKADIEEHRLSQSRLKRLDAVLQKSSAVS